MYVPRIEQGLRPTTIACSIFVLLCGFPALVSAQDAVGLEEILQMAEKNAPALRNARARTLQAKALKVGAEPLFPSNPKVSFGAGQRQDGDDRFLDYRFSLRQEVEVAGERSVRLEVAQKSEELARTLESRASWQVHATVCGLFVEGLIDEEHVLLTEEFLKFSERLYEIAEKRIDAGDASPLILLLAETDLAEARTARAAAQEHRNATLIRLAGEAGLPPEKSLTLSGELPRPRSVENVQRFVHDALQKHPALISQEAEIQVAEARVHLEDRQRWPKPSFGVNINREGGEGGGENVYLLSVGVPLPLWRTNQGARAKARAGREVARELRKTSEQAIRADILETLVALNTAAARLATYKNTLIPKTRENLALLRKAYELGEVDIHRVSQTWERLFRTSEGYIEAKRSYYSTAARLESLTGIKFWNTHTEEAP